MIFNWDENKNRSLKKNRDISFEMIVYHIELGNILDILENPNKAKYKGQKLYVINIDNYAYVVPYVVKEEKIFLKTIFPSRKYTKKYLIKEKKDGSI